MAAKKLKINYEEIVNSPLFAGVHEKTIKKIATFPEAIEHKSNEMIIKEGDFGEFMFIVLSGQVDVIKMIKDKELVVATLGPGTFIGEGALMSGAPRNATVKAKTPVKIAYFNKEAYNKMVAADATISTTLIKVHKERCKDTLKKINIAKSKSFLISSGVAGLTALQGCASFIPHLQDILNHLPPGVLALIGPAAIGAALKFQQQDMNSLVGKFDKL